MIQKNRTKIMVECALMVAMSAILQVIPFVKMANGGTITLASMAPIVFIALRHGPKWGLLTAFVGSLIQMVLGGIAPPPTQTFFYFALVVLLDYIIAYTVLGLAPLFANFTKNKVLGAGIATLVVTGLRYVCHIFSGILIWGVYAPEGVPVWLFSITYNGSYMVPEMIITTVVVTILWKAVAMRTPAKTQA